MIEIGYISLEDLAAAAPTVADGARWYHREASDGTSYEIWVINDDVLHHAVVPEDVGWTSNDPRITTSIKVASLVETGGTVGRLAPIEGGKKTIVDGMTLTTTAGSHVRSRVVLGQPAHLQGVQAQWKGCQIGDLAILVLVHPSSEGNPATEAAAGQADVDTGPLLAPLYDPAIGATCMEFWDSSGKISEVQQIIGRSANIITLGANLKVSHPVTDTIIARFGEFSPVKGTYGIDGGMRLLNDGSMLLRNELGITPVIAAGVAVGCRLMATASAGTRELTVNLLLRRSQRP